MLTHARAEGLPDGVARHAVEAVICGGADMLRRRIGTAPALVETYRSYRGTTAAGLEAAEANGFAKAVVQALEAAAQRAGSLWSD